MELVVCEENVSLNDNMSPSDCAKFTEIGPCILKMNVPLNLHIYYKFIKCYSLLEHWSLITIFTRRTDFVHPNHKAEIKQLLYTIYDSNYREAESFY